MANAFYEEAKSFKDEIIAWRRHIHSNPETGVFLPQTTSYIKSVLNDMGIDCVTGPDNSFVTALIGQGEPCILLRSDIDALPMMEESGLDFASTNGKAHTCGHDMHAATLLGAAKLLKTHEEELKGTVKLLFQTGEEIIAGAQYAIEHGILDEPKVDYAFAMHVAGIEPVGKLTTSYNPMGSAYGFRISIEGKGAHGSAPELGISPINAAVHIYLALQELVSREVAALDQAVITIGHIEAGSVNNAIPDNALMDGTLRAFNPETHKYLVKRISEVAEGIAATYRCRATVSTLNECPPMMNDPGFTDDVISIIENSFEGVVVKSDYQEMSCEDFAFFSDKAKCCYINFGAAYGKGYPLLIEHSPKVRYNEEALPLAAAIYATVAKEQLMNA